MVQHFNSLTLVRSTNGQTIECLLFTKSSNVSWVDADRVQAKLSEQYSCPISVMPL